MVSDCGESATNTATEQHTNCNYGSEAVHVSVSVGSRRAMA
jgi:hypothetical protein